MADQFALRLTPDLTAKVVIAVLLGAAMLGAVFLYHFVEEPARKCMRGMMSAPTASRPHAGPGRLHPVHAPRTDRASAVPARAG